MSMLSFISASTRVLGGAGRQGEVALTRAAVMASCFGGSFAKTKPIVDRSLAGLPFAV